MKTHIHCPIQISQSAESSSRKMFYSGKLFFQNQRHWHKEVLLLWRLFIHAILVNWFNSHWNNFSYQNLCCQYMILAFALRTVFEFSCTGSNAASRFFSSLNLLFDFKVTTFKNFAKLYDPFLWLGFNCLKTTEPLRGDSLL